MKFALAGNPNCGKTTLFNALTGATAHVGNWPGVTVDKRTGVYKKLPEKVDIIDLPGIYSLSPYTPEEIVSRNFLLDENPDCIINIVDATNLERNLYLTTQILELDVPVVVALNMTDVLQAEGGRVDETLLRQKLGVPVVSISALKSRGIVELTEAAYRAAQSPRTGATVIDGELLQAVRSAEDTYRGHGVGNALFHAVKAAEGDSLERETHAEVCAALDTVKATIDTGIFEGDFEGVVADIRYRYIDKELKGALVRKKRADGTLGKSDKIDKVLTHRIWGIPIFLLIMFAVFHLTFSENFLYLGWLIPDSFDVPIIGSSAINSPGVMLFNAMGWLTDTVGGAIGGVMPEGTWYTGLICDGLLEGLFSVLSFIPQILCLFLWLSILEDSGYMARVAFIMDRAFRKFGLSGKAFMPLIMCFGCAVPGIMATRTLENEPERRRTVMLAPFFSCGAKLPIWAAFGGVFAQAFTGMNAEVVVYSMYVLGIAIAILASLLLKLTIVKGETPPFIMELPAYHAPRAKNIAVRLWEKLKHYVIRAATVIAGAIVVIWFLSNFSFTFRYVPDDSGMSMLGMIGKGLSWLFVPLGFGMGENGWKFVVAAFTGLIAKEMVVATMGTFAGMDGDEALETDGAELADTALGAMMLSIGGVLGGFSAAIPAMFAFMAFNLLSVPCMAAVAAAGGELNSKRKLWTAIGFWMLTAYLTALVVFWYGMLCVVCWWAAMLVGIAVVGGMAALAVLKAKGLLAFGKKRAPGQGDAA